MKLMYQKRPSHGLFPIKVSNQDGSFVDSQITFGALGDSFYEYLLKIWLQGGRKETWLRNMYDKAMDGMIDKLLLKSSISGLAFLSDWNGRYNNRKMDHLVCFVPGMLALGAYTNSDGIESSRAKRDLAVAKALMYTCYQMYHRMPSGISAEFVLFPNEKTDFYAGGWCITTTISNTTTTTNASTITNTTITAITTTTTSTASDTIKYN